MSLRNALAEAGMESDDFDELSLLNNTDLDAQVGASVPIKVVRRGAP